MARKAKLTPAAAALLLAALFGLACGDDGTTETSTATAAEATTTDAETSGTPEGEDRDDEKAEGKEPPSDREQVEAAIEALLTDPDSARVCRRVITEGLVRIAYGDLQGCLRGRRNEPLARSVRIKSLMLDGDAASAEATPKGGLYSGETLAIEAVRTPGGWRIDAFVADVPVGP